MKIRSARKRQLSIRPNRRGDSSRSLRFDTLESRNLLACDVAGLFRLPGDSTNNGLFTSSDLVKVFEAGKYEQRIDASWSEGDWNDDRRFDSGDLVDAFVAGCYESGQGLPLAPSWFSEVSPDMITPVNANSVTDVSFGGNTVRAVAFEWIVTLKDSFLRELESPADLEESFKAIGAQVLGGSGVRGEFLVRMPTSATPDVEQIFAQLGYIERFEPNTVLSAEGLTDDPRLSELWGLNNTGQTGGTPDADIDAVEAWDVTIGSRDVVVAVIDSGIDYTHPDLAANIWTNLGEIANNGLDDDNNGFVDDIHGYDFANSDADPMDDNGHGTHVAGTIGAFGNNSLGISGVSPLVRLMALKFLGSNGSGSSYAAIRAINYATMMANRGAGVRVTNNSWGGSPGTDALRQAIADSGAAGVMFVASAGNGGSDRIGDDNDQLSYFPSSFDLTNIVSVAATDHNDNLATFSNYGKSAVDVAAPGVSILSTVPAFYDASMYSSFRGTSMATPHVTGIAALAWALKPQASIREVKDAILLQGDPLPSLESTTVSGRRVNALATLHRLSQPIGNESLIGDFDGDQRDDWSSVSFDPVRGLTVRTAFSNGDGTFRDAEWIGADGEMFGPLVGDVNGDGKDDLLFHYHDNTQGLIIRTKLSRGDGSFEPQSFVSGDGQMEFPLIGDFDGDRKADLAFYEWDNTLGLVVRTKFSNGDGSFRSVEWVSGDGELLPPVVGDINGDGKTDLVFHFFDDINGMIVRTKLSNGDGTYHSVQEIEPDDELPLLLVGDANADGKDDLLLPFHDELQGLTVRNKLSAGDGSFAGTEWLSRDGQMLTPVVGDMNGDGRSDLVFHYYDGFRGLIIRTKFSNGDGTYRGEEWLSRDGSLTGPLVADVDGNGIDDLVFDFVDGIRGLIVRTKFSNGDGSYRPTQWIVAAG